MAGSWSLLTNHARALLFIFRDPDARLRDLAVGLGVTERTAYGIVADLTEAGYVVKEKEGRRNRYQIQAHLPIPDSIGQPSVGPESTGREHTIGEILELLVDEPRRRDR
jgi:DNA-binding transcriptional ArsR family regulator